MSSPVPTALQNTIGAGGYLIRPFEHVSLPPCATQPSPPSPADPLCPHFQGADIIVHSATKWIAGNGTSLGGLVISSGKFNFKGNPRFPEFEHELAGFPGLVVTAEDGQDPVSQPYSLTTPSKGAPLTGGTYDPLSAVPQAAEPDAA